MSLQPYASPRRTTPRKSSAAQTHSAFAFSAPIKGVDISQPLPGGNPFTAIRLENLIPRVLGCQLRKGFRRWQSNLSGEVRSFMQYQPANGPPQLFAACSDGDVFDVTVFHDSSFIPVPVVAVPGGTPPGEWTSLNFTTSAGAHVMVAVARAGGLYIYDGTTWTEVEEGTDPGQIDGVDPGSFTSVMSYKGVLIFTQFESTKAWYLPVGQFAGTATEFDFGALLPNGGYLSAIVNWTFDGGGAVATGTGAATGGGGMDNKLVIIASQGDVLVYSGEDINEAASFRMEGRWFVGRVPAGDRFVSQYGQDVTILSEKGLCFMSELLRGQGFFQNAEIAQQINSELAWEVAPTLDSRYWEVRFLPHEQLIVINRPDPDFNSVKWAYEVNNKAFCTLAGIPMNTVINFNGLSYCGDLSGNVWLLFDGDSDGVVDGVPGKDLEGTCVTTFQPMGEGFRIKRFLMARASFISISPPAYKLQLNSEWDLNTPGGAPPYIRAGDNLWDQGKWDNAVWSGSGKSYEAWQGATGTGRYASLALQLRGAADTVFIGWQAVVEQGGIL